MKKECKECSAVFEVNEKLKRERKKLFCSIVCARRNNGKRNKNRKHLEETKSKLSLLNKGDKNRFYGKKHTNETKEKISEANKGKLSREKHPNWKGGIKTRPDGYLRDSETDQYIHRKVMEEFLERKLNPSEHIHHKNGIKSDNRIENLEILTNSKHRKLECAKQNRDNRGVFTK